ncbi:MAG TPA: hypothetical protein VNO52_08265, partial [Methylomirabilota bacterium]|nr:hypothetical protein [Methylomirabilota bacterium]
MKSIIRITLRALTLAVALTSAPVVLAEDITVSDDIAADTHWRNTNTYFLDGFVYVLSGATLHIEAGTVIKGLGAPTTGESAS